MKGFKDYVQSDVSSVFFNQQEFADTHNIDGKDIPVVIDADTSKEENVNGGSMYATHSGVMLSEFAIFVRTADIEKPVISQHIFLDNARYIVTDVQETAGVYQITLGANIA